MRFTNAVSIPTCGTCFRGYRECQHRCSHKVSTSSKLDEAKAVLEALSAQVQQLKIDEVFKKLEELEAIEKRERYA